MRRPVQLTLVRHGETTLNVARVIQGHKDATLSKNGEVQAETLGKHLADQKFTRVYSSDLVRAYATTELIMKQSNQPNPVKIVKDPRLRERCFGEMEGKHFSLLYEEADKLGIDKTTYTPKGGETLKQARDRMQDFFRDLCLLADEDFDESLISDNEENILLVSHGGVLLLLVKALENGKDSFNLQGWDSKRIGAFKNTSVTCMTIYPLVPDGEEARQKRTISFSAINDISHLNPSQVSTSWDAV